MKKQCLDEDKVNLQLHNAVGNCYEDMAYVLFVRMVVRKVFFCIRCRRFPDESENDITISKRLKPK